MEGGGQATPAQLIEVLNRFFLVFDKLDREHGPRGPIPYDDVNELGDHALGCLMDLGIWAENLGLPEQKHEIEKTALEVAQWIIRHGGKLRTLEPVVNALAVSANHTDTEDALKALYQTIADVIEHTAPEIKDDLEKSNPARPWRVLNFNFAIVATRTQERGLMIHAFETLGRHLPGDCSEFFEEAVRQAEKPVYGSEVKALAREYFSKWTVRH